MKNIKRIAYILVIVVIFVLGLTIYTNASKNNQNDTKEKTISEVKYLESKLLNLLNTMNNLETRNYNISVSEMSKESTQKQSEESSSSSSGGGSTQGQSGGGSSGSESSQTSNDKQDNQKYELKLSGVLTAPKDINWDSISSEVEMLYSSIPSITMDLYQFDINQNDILSFNQEFDNLTVAIKEKNKEKTLAKLSKLYDQLPKFLPHISQDELYNTTVETKANIIKAYSKLDSNNWNDISNDVKNAIQSFSKLLSNTRD